MSKYKIKCIYVGLGNFSLKRLQVMLKGDIFEPVVFVDINTQKPEKQLSELENIPKDYKKRIFKTISDANKIFKAPACLIFAGSLINVDSGLGHIDTLI